MKSCYSCFFSSYAQDSVQVAEIMQRVQHEGTSMNPEEFQRLLLIGRAIAEARPENLVDGPPLDFHDKPLESVRMR